MCGAKEGQEWCQRDHGIVGYPTLRAFRAVDGHPEVVGVGKNAPNVEKKKSQTSRDDEEGDEAEGVLVLADADELDDDADANEGAGIKGKGEKILNANPLGKLPKLPEPGSFLQKDFDGTRRSLAQVQQWVLANARMIQLEVDGPVADPVSGEDHGEEVGGDAVGAGAGAGGEAAALGGAADAEVHRPGFDDETLVFAGNHSVFPGNLPANIILHQIIRAYVEPVASELPHNKHPERVRSVRKMREAEAAAKAETAAKAKAEAEAKDAEL